jgi:hypothetical protein
MSTEPHATDPAAGRGQQPDQPTGDRVGEERTRRFERPEPSSHGPATSVAPSREPARPAPAAQPRPEAPPPQRESQDDAATSAAIELSRPEQTAIAAAGADVFADIPQAHVEELLLELQATSVIENLKVSVKGLELSLLLRADLDNMARMLADRRERSDGGRGGLVRRLAPAVAGGAGGRLLEHAGGETRGGSESRGGGEPQGGGSADDAAQPGRAGAVRDDTSRSGGSSLGQRAGKVAAATAAGVGVAALAGSRLEPLKKAGVDLSSLPGPLGGRKRGLRGVAQRVKEALPG